MIGEKRIVVFYVFSGISVTLLGRKKVDRY